MNRYLEARDRGVAWLLTKLHEDGSYGDGPPDVRVYYKVPCAFLVAGKSDCAAQMLQWIRRHGMTNEGDFGPPTGDARPEYWYSYTNSWVVIGAHRLNQFDISQRGMDFLMRTWDGQSGGFYSSYDPGDENTQADLWVVAGAGRAALITGRIDAARGVGRWMRQMMDQQPDYPRRMYTVASRARGVITNFPPDEALRYVLERDAAAGDQYFFHPGIAGGFLANLYQATGEREWLELAQRYMLLAEGATDHLFRLGRAGKVGWASAVLYTLTGDEKYRRMAIRVADNLIARQAPDGYWGTMGGSEPHVDATAELSIWLDEIGQALGPD